MGELFRVTEQGSDEMKAVFKEEQCGCAGRERRGKYYRHGHDLGSCALHGHQVTKNRMRDVADDC